MGHTRLAAYLNDHLAGAAAALELLERLADGGEPGFAASMRALHAEIEQDRGCVESLLDRIGAKPSGAKKAAGWLAEKVARLKIGAASDAFGRFESLEVLGLGILGKQALWRALAALAAPELAATDFAELLARAERQHQQVEDERQRLVVSALG